MLPSPPAGTARCRGSLSALSCLSTARSGLLGVLVLGAAGRGGGGGGGGGGARSLLTAAAVCLLPRELPRSLPMQPGPGAASDPCCACACPAPTPQVCNAYTELNDPLRQRELFSQQAAVRGARGRRLPPSPAPPSALPRHVASIHAQLPSHQYWSLQPPPAPPRPIRFTPAVAHLQPQPTPPRPRPAPPPSPRLAGQGAGRRRGHVC